MSLRRIIFRSRSRSSSSPTAQHSFYFTSDAHIKASYHPYANLERPETDAHSNPSSKLVQAIHSTHCYLLPSPIGPNMTTKALAAAIFLLVATPILRPVSALPTTDEPAIQRGAAIQGNSPVLQQDGPAFQDAGPIFQSSGPAIQAGGPVLQRDDPTLQGTSTRPALQGDRPVL